MRRRQFGKSIALLATIFGLSACQAAAPPPTPTQASQPEGSAVASSSGTKQWSAPPPMTIDPQKQYSAVIKTTMGDMTAELYASDVPITVNNFVFLSNQHFYDNVPFHRIIKGFMVQTGDPTGTGAGGPGYRFKDEPMKPPHNTYTRGTLAMANAGPNTNGSQFFIMHADYPLPPNYTIFGKLTAGLDVLDKIANVPVTTSATGEKSKPTVDVRIETITIEEK